MTQSHQKLARLPLTSAHWGTYRIAMENGVPTSLHGFEDDPKPSLIGQSILDTLDGPCRISTPMVRRSFLDHGLQNDRTLRGRDSFVEVSWDHALDLVAEHLSRTRDQYGNPAIYGGSYGWASAGRFHHAQSQLRRFMNLFGGCTTSKNSYSYAAAEVILPHVVAPMGEMLKDHTSWRSIQDKGGLVVAFGGIAPRNGQVDAGGMGRHSQVEDMHAARKAGVEFVNISPDKSDFDVDLGAEWFAIRPNTDVALMLALAHTLVSDGLHDLDFLNRYCVGFEHFLGYLTGSADGQAKDADWASTITDIPADAIVGLARRMAKSPTLINASWSLTRQQNGEQVYWMLVVLASVLGGIGKPGRGFGLGLGAVGGVGKDRQKSPWASLPTGHNPVSSFIPVARIADMLLHPGKSFIYDGGSYTYPDIRLVYWAGGNPFHHHQDLNRLRRAWQKIETVIVHEPFWTPLARHADIVLPATVALERNDLAGSSRDNYLIASSQAVKPNGQACNDHDIFAALAKRLRPGSGGLVGFEDEFTEDYNETQWLKQLYQQTASQAANLGHHLPDFEVFLETGIVKLDAPSEPPILLESFRNDPISNPLKTPSGRIEIFSQTIANFVNSDLRGHPEWREPDEWLGSTLTEKYPLHLISHQPARRLHSQLDHGSHSRAGKVNGREPCRINPDDGAKRGICDGDLVRIFNGRGACMSSALIDPGVRAGVLMIATGAWYDPDWTGDKNCCKHGNPNTLTPDLPTSGLAQGPGAMTCLVEIERITGEAPQVTAFSPPNIIKGG